MNKNLYPLLVVVSALLILVGFLFAIFGSDPRLQASGAVATGLGASLVASTLIQAIASKEQSELLRDLVLRIEGRRPLSPKFKELTWCAYTTRVTNNVDQVLWKIGRLERIMVSGESLAFYKLIVPAPNDGSSDYRWTFIGLAGCVLAVSAKGDERCAITTFDTPVQDNIVFFGSGYTTDWEGRRCSTAEIVGVGDVPSLAEVRARAFSGFEQWFKSVHWDAQSGLELLRNVK